MPDISDSEDRGSCATNYQIHMVGIGLGVKEHLTVGAEQQLVRASRVYVMAAEDSWIVQFVADIVGKGKVRTYMPASVKWNSGWQHDAIFKEVADEVCVLVDKGQHIAFAMAGDVAIYGNVADSIIPIFQQRGLMWDVFPGVSFLNAISMVTGEPIVGEADNFVVTFAQTHAQLDEAFAAANVLVLYNPGGSANLHGYIDSRRISYARMVVQGVYRSKAMQVDLVKNRAAIIRGLVILKRPQSFFQQALRDASTAISELVHHIGANGWNSKRQFFATCYPNKLMWSPTGNPDQLELRYAFPDHPDDLRGFFMDSKDVIYVSLKGHRKGVFGRTYSSRDGGKNFELTIERCCWAFDEDREGNLFAGVYHERGEPNAACAILWSSDRGKTWIDISPSEWREQNHVHHLAVSPHTGWLYANLGDVTGLRGCWRNKNEHATIIKTALAGSRCLEVQGSLKWHLPGDAIYLSGVGALQVDSISGRKLLLQEPLTQEVSIGEKLLSVSWRLKFGDAGNTLQFIGMVFEDEEILLANDTWQRGESQRVIVYSVRDDGTDGIVEPKPSLQAVRAYGWGCFSLEMDPHGRVWAALRPISGRGAIWTRDRNKTWEVIAEVEEEDLPCWRGTHTYRDGTLGQTGAGANLGNPNGGSLFPYLNRSRLIKR